MWDLVPQPETDWEPLHWGGFPGGSAGKESACNAGDLGLISELGRSPGEGKGYPLQYSWASLVAQLVKNLPACRRPGFDLWVGKIPWRRQRLPTPVCWPGEFHGHRHGDTESDTTERLSLSLSVCHSVLPWLPLRQGWASFPLGLTLSAS